MLEIKTLEEVRGNNVVIYSIKTLLDKGTFPKFTILSGNMGVGKSTVARIVAEQLNNSMFPVTVFNFGLKPDMKKLEETVFKLKPNTPRAFVFEELHGLDKDEQTALLTMLDYQPDNVYILCTTTKTGRILRTIRSRAVEWDFKLLGKRQLSQLLDDYLESQGVELTLRAKSALLKSAFGVPRDLIKNADLAISGEFSGEQLDELLGNVSEDLIFALLCSLKSTNVDFSTNVATLMDGASQDTLTQFRDFFTRFLLERKDIDNATISSDKMETLESLFSNDELMKIGHTLVRATPETLILELSLLNISLTNVTKGQIVGQQLDRAARHMAEATAIHPTEEVKARRDNAKVSRRDLSKLTLD